MEVGDSTSGVANRGGGPLFLKRGTGRVCSNYRGTSHFSASTGRSTPGVLEGLWEFAQPVHMCFVDLEKAFDRVPYVVFCGGAFAKGCSVSVRPEQELGFALPAMMLYCWLHQARTFSMYWRRFAAECEAAGMRISTSKSEAMVLDRKRVACPLRVGGEVLPQVEGVQVSRGLVHEKDKISGYKRPEKEFPPQGGWALP
ncbi:hypothetical protein L3Q82_013809 [Scortum barcoo]|uniref:Uncharacterized protein n=1 Tax=Scortum barcoo TaxID=214431 RepID=A0ACB8VVU0_9TELE|nr:hypothetical protein L3Q82_013809 [Scortum barcoo]